MTVEVSGKLVHDGRVSEKLAHDGRGFRKTCLAAAEVSGKTCS